MNESNKIKSVQIERYIYPLKKPYKLSFVNLSEFISIQVILTLENGESSRAEVVPLFGYNEENEETIFGNLKNWEKEIIGKSISDARPIIAKKINSASFSTSPYLTAIDLFDFPLINVSELNLDYVVPTSTEEIENLHELLKDSNNCIKIKLLGDLKVDISFIQTALQLLLKHPVKFRLDANQAYSLNMARELFKYFIDSGFHENILYVEQPLPVGKEADILTLRQEFPAIDVMLDESIVSIEDVDMAKSVSANFIKLKLFKQGGIFELIDIAKKAKQNQIKVVLGNGVSTSISNQVENTIYFRHKDLFLSPLESNGFLKVR